MKARPTAQPRPAPTGIDATRLLARRGLLKLLEEQDRLFSGRPRRTGGLDQFREQAYSHALVARPPGAFDLDREPPQLRDRYGRNEYGESFLLARRLVESGVRVVTVVWMYICPDGNVANVWDNHGGTGSLGGITGYAMLKEKYCLPPLDRGFSALLEDLSARGLLDETLVACLASSAARRRSTRPPAATTGARASRRCWLAAASAAGRFTAPATSTRPIPGASPSHRRTMLATIYYALGLPPRTEIADRLNRPMRICEGTPLARLF